MELKNKNNVQSFDLDDKLTSNQENTDSVEANQEGLLSSERAPGSSGQDQVDFPKLPSASDIEALIKQIKAIISVAFAAITLFIVVFIIIQTIISSSFTNQAQQANSKESRLLESLLRLNAVLNQINGIPIALPTREENTKEIEWRHQNRTSA